MDYAQFFLFQMGIRYVQQPASKHSYCRCRICSKIFKKLIRFILQVIVYPNLNCTCHLKYLHFFSFYYNVISLLFQYIYNESDVFLSNKYLSFTLFFQFLYKIIIHKSLILSFQRAKKELPLNSRNSS